jgi:hypothetical protein
MLDFVVWAFAIALFPLVLALAWSLIVTVGKWIGLGLSQVLGDAEPRRHAHPLSFDTPSGSLSMAAKARCRHAGRVQAPHWDRPSGR